MANKSTGGTGSDDRDDFGTGNRSGSDIGEGNMGNTGGTSGGMGQSEELDRDLDDEIGPDKGGSTTDRGKQDRGTQGGSDR